MNETGRKLLEAAAHIFAVKGYQGATIQDICRLAGANIAAVNYHFRDKKTLYVEAWRHAFSISIKKYPPDGGVSADAPAEERFRGYIEALLGRITDEENLEFWIARKEIANPTGLLKEVMRDELMPLHARMESVVRDILGPGASEPQVRCCVISIASQCFEPVVINRAIKEQGDPHPPPIDIKQYIEHVVRFSLGALKALRASGAGKTESSKKATKAAR